MSGCRINGSQLIRSTLNKMSFCETCLDERLRIPNCVCSVDFKKPSLPFGPISEKEKENILEKKFYLMFDGNDKFRFSTRNRSKDSGKSLIKFLNIELLDSSKGIFKNVASINADTTLRPLKLYVEIWRYDVDKRKYMQYPNDKKPALSISIQDLIGDPLNLPRDLGSTFYVRIVATGTPFRKRQIVPNFRLYVECRGYYDFAIEEDAALDTRVEPGTVKTLANGKLE